jgi:hypothetical protein
MQTSHYNPLDTLENKAQSKIFSATILDVYSHLD